MSNKLDKLKKILEVSSRDTISAKEIEQFIVLVLTTIKTERDSFKNLSDEQLSTINEKVSFIDSIKDDFKSLFVDEIKEAKKLLNEISKIKSKPGKDGKDYVLTKSDKEEIASFIEVPIVEKTEVIREVPQDILGETIVDKINELPVNDNELKIDASHIKNLPISNNVGGGTKYLQYLIDTNIQTPTDGQVLTYDSTTSSWRNEASSGGTIDGSGIANQLPYWVDVDTLGSLSTVTYPSLTELSYVKGVTSAIQTQLNAKQATLVSGTNIKTINGVTLLGSSDIVIDATVTLADLSANSATTPNSLYTMTAGIPVEFRRSGGNTLFYLNEIGGTVSFGTSTQYTNATLSIKGLDNVFDHGITFKPENETITTNLGWGGITSNWVFYILGGGPTSFGTSGAYSNTFITNNVERWVIDANGNFIGGADNTYDIGASGATRPRTGYFGTNVVIGANIELGHATDTTISRVSAGLIAVEGVNVATISTTVTANTIVSGTYTPTRSAEVNITGNVTTFENQYMRVGNTVTVSGRFTATPTAATTATSFEITLPVASNIGAVEDLAGVGFCGAIAGMGCAIEGSVANDKAVFSWVSSDITAKSWSYQFSYQVI